MINIIGVIPARLGSSRFPDKPLVRVRGEITLIEECIFSCIDSNRLDKLFLTSCDDELMDSVRRISIRKFGKIRTSTRPVNGTERVYESLRHMNLKGRDIVVNIQGDQFHYTLSLAIDKLVDNLILNPKIDFSTLVCFNLSESDYFDPNVVKAFIKFGSVCVDDFFRIKKDPFEGNGILGFHIGIYGFRWRALKKYVNWRQTQREKDLSLEQLRILDHNEKIFVESHNVRPYSINVPEDLKRLENINAYY